jgi:hypothetical protein
MGGGLAVLGAVPMQRRIAAELDLAPFEVRDLAGAQTVAVGNEDQGTWPTCQSWARGPF